MASKSTVNKANKRQAEKRKKSGLTGPDRSGCGKKRTNKMSGFGVARTDDKVGSFQAVLKAEHEERELRKELMANAALHPVVQTVRDNAVAIKDLLPTLSGTRMEQSKRKLAQLERQIIEIDAALVNYGFKSNVTNYRRTDAILDIRMSSGYLRKIVRDALFGALREHDDEQAPLTDAMAD
ncbi:MAG: hypothetical protein ABIP74_04490 [Candidatus Saccharimonas sp.]